MCVNVCARECLSVRAPADVKVSPNIRRKLRQVEPSSQKNAGTFLINSGDKSFKFFDI